MIVNNELDLAIAKLDRLHAERGKLQRELKRSLALERLWPEAFSGDRNPTTQVKGNPRREMTFTMYNGNDTRELPLEEVPVILWPEAVKNDIRRIGWNARSVYRNLLKEEDNATDTKSV